MIMRQFLSPVLTILLLCLAASGTAVSVGFGPFPQTALPGQVFTSTLGLDTATQIHGYNLSIRYESAKISFVSAQRGSLFIGQSVFWWQVNTDTLNVVNVVCILAGQATVTGPGSLLNLNFTAGAEDLTQLQVSSIKFYDLSGGYFTGIDTSPKDIIIGSQPAYARIRCWLQGPYAEGGMQSSLNNLLPGDSPYPEAPATVDSIPPDVVDWVLLELLSDPGGPAYLSRSLWLDQNGELRAPGVSLVAFGNVSSGPFHLRVRHRNHLAATSLAAIPLASSGDPPLCDLRLPANVMDSSAAVDLGNGYCALAAGDANRDGSINSLDRDQGWRPQAGRNGYLSGDFDLDGNAFPNDLNAFWRPNQVPVTGFRNERGPIRFSQSNPELQELGDGVILHLDILASAVIPGNRLGTGMMLMEYNPAVFGEFLVSSAGLSVAPGELLGEYGSMFQIWVNDRGPKVVAITFEYIGSPDDGPLLSSEPACILELGFRVQQLCGPAGLHFCQELMQGQQYKADNAILFSLVDFEELEQDHLPSPPQNPCLNVADGIALLTWDPVPGCEYSVYTTQDPHGGEWTREAVQLQSEAWVDACPQGRKFYKVVSTKTRTGF